MKRLTLILITSLLLVACAQETEPPSLSNNLNLDAPVSSAEINPEISPETPEPTPFPRTDSDFMGTELAPFLSGPVTLGPEVKLQFRAAVITHEREVMPVVNTSFEAYPYPLQQVKDYLARKNNAPDKPLEPQESDAKYQRVERNCGASGCSEKSVTDMASFQADMDTYHSQTLPEWEAKAYAGLEAELEKLVSEDIRHNFRTNLNGEAELTLGTGRWYFSGRYQDKNQAVEWTDIPFEVSASTQALDLIR